ncbi:MAG: carboxypeptidase regulatory-like domain-containing protein [Roseiflexaceae bacterium]|nr:carboxypeptidase regulatory-like domain-containing protein [Roseiflexaceae bacterium]
MSIRVSSFAAVALLVAMLLAGCGGPGVPLTGTVVDTYTGKPVSAAQVQVGRNTVTADASGMFSIASWSTADALQVSAAGYEPVTIALEGQQQLANPTPPAASVETSIRPNTLSGTLTDTYTGQPLAGALVKATTAISATSGADGRYTLAGLPENFELAITAADYAPLAETISRVTSFDAQLRPNSVVGTVTDQYTGQPLPNVAVKAGDATATTGADGTYKLGNLAADATVEISAAGYSSLTQPIEQLTTIDATLRPDVLSGTLVDANTGKPIAFATVFAGTAIGANDVATTRIDNVADGSFTIEGLPERGVLYVLAPGYKRAEFEISPGVVPTELKLEPIQVKAWYVTAAVGTRTEYLFDEYFSMIDKTELNAVVIDLKSDLRDDLGLVYYDSQAPMVKELGTARDYMDIKAIVAEAKKRGIYTVARIQLFSHDNALADVRPEWGVKDKKTGEVYADYPGPGIRYAYLDPTNKNVWEYNIQLGEEAAQLGFDEVNYDYIRFTDWSGDLQGFTDRLEFSEPVDPKSDPDKPFQVINGFLAEAHPRVNKAGAFFSIDFFGRTVLKRSLPIGQDIATAAEHSDYISPMIYPSLFWGGYLDLDLPAAEPYKVIFGSLESAAPLFAGKRAQNRPWLQDHTDPWQARVVEYGPAEVRAQIDATETFDPAMGWMLYNSANAYHDEAVKPE